MSHLAAQRAGSEVQAGCPVTVPIIGATKPHHIDDAVAALDLVLTDDEQSQQLESAYEPHEPVGF